MLKVFIAGHDQSIAAVASLYVAGLVSQRHPHLLQQHWLPAKATLMNQLVRITKVPVEKALHQPSK